MDALQYVARCTHLKRLGVSEKIVPGISGFVGGALLKDLLTTKKDKADESVNMKECEDMEREINGLKTVVEDFRKHVPLPRITMRLCRR